jgi:hypothetical protein
MLGRLKHTLGNFWTLRRRFNQTEGDVSPRRAQALQRLAADKSQLNEPTVCTPPYLIVAESLEAPELQVFEAAVFYLYKIAENRPSDRAAIEEILNGYMQTHADRTERLQLIRKYGQSGHGAE